jgi:hypothetical protein
MREWKAKYVPNPDMTMEEHLESYRDNTLKSTLLAAPWESLRVLFDYRHLDMSSATKTERDFIVQELMEPLRSYFDSILKIKRNPAGTVLPAGSCFSKPYDAFNYPNIDLVVFVTASNAPGESWLARAGACDLD